MVQNYDATAQAVAIASPGATLGTDWEQRVDFGRLRSERARKVQDELASSELGSLILFDMNNIRRVIQNSMLARRRTARVRHRMRPGRLSRADGSRCGRSAMT